LAYISPSCQIPTAAVLSRARREKLLQWAQANKTTIVEEDTNCEFSFDSRIIPSIHSLDDSARTFYIGAPASIFPEQMHLAFMVVPEAVRAPFTRLKSLANRCTSPILQRLMLRMFETEYVPERIRKLQRLLELRRATLLEELGKIPAGNVIYSPAKGGTFQCVWLSSQIDDLALGERCSSSHVLPASPYYLQPAGRPGLSISFAQPAESIIACAQFMKDALPSQQQTNSTTR
jgi:GntR family transcriptional regulator/MocR family aminotransferase